MVSLFRVFNFRGGFLTINYKISKINIEKYLYLFKKYRCFDIFMYFPFYFTLLTYWLLRLLTLTFLSLTFLALTLRDRGQEHVFCIELFRILNFVLTSGILIEETP